MRKIIDTLIVLMLITLVGGMVWHYQQGQRDLDQCAEVQDALTRMYEQTVAHTTVDKKSTQAGFPRVISPQWFGQELPRNVMAPSAPWLDQAPKGDMSDHPPDPVLEQSTQAGFWYNANLGIIRARVPRQLTDMETVSLYNRINQTSLKTLQHDVSAERAPIALGADGTPIDATPDKPVRGLGKSGSTGARASANDGPVTSPAPRRTLRDYSTN